MRKPDFFIIGAPKCGTTSLARYLGEHENIFMSEPKEPHYFNTDFANRHTTDLEVYQSYFAAANNAHLAVGEASVLYLYSDAAVKNVLSFSPSARFIVMVRNPLDVAHACHSQALRSHGELVASFEKAWSLQEQRKRGENIPGSCKEKKVLLYGEIARIGMQLSRMRDLIEEKRVLILFMDDLRDDAVSVYKKTLSFLGVPYDGRVEFPVHNANQRIRSPRVRQIIEQAQHFKNRLGIKRGLGIFGKLKKINAEQGQRKPIGRPLRAEMLEYFEEDIRRIEEITNRDLAHWRRL